VDDRSAPRPGLYEAEGKEALFRSGRAAIFQGSPTMASQLTEDPPGFEWEMGFVPPGPGGQTMAGDFGYYCIASKTDNEDAAWEYAKFLTSRPVVEKQLQNVLWAVQPVRTDIGDEVLAKAPSWVPQLIQEFIPKVITYTAHPQQLDGLEAIVEEFGLLVRGRKTAEQAVQDANERLTEIAKS
jgi:ABC-type glycerol-3-phosphate transport system substrate-binding protein